MREPEYRVCPDCTEYTALTCDAVGDLPSRDFALRQVRSLTFPEIDSKHGSPDGWLNHVMNSILELRQVTDPLGLVRSERGLELLNGNHRAWTAYTHRLDCHAYIFTPVCGTCTEALFLDSINAWTRAIGWMYHQQGFRNTPTSWGESSLGERHQR